jgi:hypothetical protein
MKRSSAVIATCPRAYMFRRRSCFRPKGKPAGTKTSTSGFSVGNFVVETDGQQHFTVEADGNVSEGANEVTAAGVPDIRHRQLAVDGCTMFHSWCASSQTSAATLHRVEKSGLAFAATRPIGKPPLLITF